ncbi:GPW/gp25 family protein [Streptomyces alanosinicus]|uniref:Baseplate protein n=1 Tax=Streptomyces alanosinicus TaxID=68171 RepID=A0A918YMY6_9ACTN|nr:GPW/gp25 family protein [Streptomyces alanosinicus]GHE08569.1 baseplate protein [Streptomyces alanosinicus]
MTGPLAFPLRPDGTGRTASADPDQHIRDLIGLVLLTEPGERVMRPDFGCGLRAMVFAPLGDVMATTTQALVQAQLHTWLDDVISIDQVTAEAREDGSLVVTVAYRRRADGTPGSSQVVVPA